ncbi:hypothetical protein [Streptomyces sp. NPDC001068]|uniref:hypothetical protein n=1 Tax=Streptomyces sp. NPDC001068 TaxID=3364544 RepID=UPI00369988B3
MSPYAALVGALVLATAVNLVTVVLAATGVWLLVAGTWPQRVLGAIGCLLAVALRPRPATLPRHTLDPAAAPALHAVAQRITTRLGTRPVDTIAVDARYGWDSLTVGVRRRHVLVLGLPLWETLPADERLALLAHALGGNFAGAPHRAWIRTALDALSTWADLISPAPHLDNARQEVLDSAAFTAGGTATIRQNSGATMGQALAWPLQNLMAHGILLLQRTLSRLDQRSSGRADFRADEIAARITSPAAVDGLLRALVLTQPARLALELAIQRRVDVWTHLRTSLASLPDLERQRHLRLSQLGGDGNDGSPSLYLRIQHIAGLPHSHPALTLDEEELHTIDGELLPVKNAIGEETV